MKPPDFEVMLFELFCLHVPVMHVEESGFLREITHGNVKLRSEKTGSAVGQIVRFNHPLVFINDSQMVLFYNIFLSFYRRFQWIKICMILS